MSFQYGSELVLIENCEHKYDLEPYWNICYGLNKRFEARTKLSIYWLRYHRSMSCLYHALNGVQYFRIL